MAVTVAVATSGCTTSRGDQTDNKGYVSGDRSITVIDAADRKQAPTLEGDKLGGGRLDTADYAGQVIVSQRLGCLVRGVPGRG